VLVEEEVEGQLVAVAADRLISLERLLEGSERLGPNHVGAEGEEAGAERARHQVIARKLADQRPVARCVNAAPPAQPSRQHLDVKPAADIGDRPEPVDGAQAVQRTAHRRVGVAVDDRSPAAKGRREQVKLAGQHRRLSAHLGAEQRLALVDEDPPLGEPLRLSG
jgi:hypothetical protein